jgi:phosphoribosylpyrophosphate synthetase
MENFNQNVVFFCGQGNYPLNELMLKELTELTGEKCSVGHINFNLFPDKELDDRFASHKNIKGKTVVFFQSLYSQELFDEATDLIWACKHQYGATHIIGIFPFFLGRRQDAKMESGEEEIINKKTPKPDEIQRLRKNISILKFCGVNEMIVATPHSQAMEDACKEYNVKFHEIDPSKIFATKIQTFVQEEEWQLIKTYAPDWGSIPRAVKLAKILNCPVVFSLKDRKLSTETSSLEVEAHEIEKIIKYFKDKFNFDNIHFITPELIKDSIIVMVEDEVSTGGTANNTAQVIVSMGSRLFILLATHPVLTSGWKNKLFQKNPFAKVVMADSIPRGYAKSTGGKITDITLSELLASKLFQILKNI